MTTTTLKSVDTDFYTELYSKLQSYSPILIGATTAIYSGIQESQLYQQFSSLLSFPQKKAEKWEIAFTAGFVDHVVDLYVNDLKVDSGKDIVPAFKALNPETQQEYIDTTLKGIDLHYGEFEPSPEMTISKIVAKELIFFGLGIGHLLDSLRLPT